VEEHVEIEGHLTLKSCHVVICGDFQLDGAKDNADQIVVLMNSRRVR
jgi:hypothetical protein